MKNSHEVFSVRNMLRKYEDNSKEVVKLKYFCPHIEIFTINSFHQEDFKMGTLGVGNDCHSQNRLARSKNLKIEL